MAIAYRIDECGRMIEDSEPDEDSWVKWTDARSELAELREELDSRIRIINSVKGERDAWREELEFELGVNLEQAEDLDEANSDLTEKILELSDLRPLANCLAKLLGQSIKYVEEGIYHGDKSAEELVLAANTAIKENTDIASADYEYARIERNNLQQRLTTAEQRNAELEKDAERWNAFINCARIKFFGWAGYEEKDPYGNSPGNYRHFGGEFWSMHTAPTADKEKAKSILNGFADAAIAAAQPTE